MGYNVSELIRQKEKGRGRRKKLMIHHFSCHIDLRKFHGVQRSLGM
jgi:hypothetical protein